MKILEQLQRSKESEKKKKLSRRVKWSALDGKFTDRANLPKSLFHEYISGWV